MPPTVTLVSVSVSSPTVIARDSINATVTMRESTGQMLPNALSEVTVASSNSTVASVRVVGSGENALLRVLGVAPGTARISVTALGQSGFADVTVLPAVDIVRATPDSLSLEIFEVDTLSVVTLRSNGDTLFDRTVTFSIQDAAIATVGGIPSQPRQVTVRGIAGGFTNIIATVADRADTIPVEVIVDRALTVTGMRSGGSGVVTSDPVGINCTITAGIASDSGCVATFKSNQTVRLTAATAGGHQVHSWQELQTLGAYATHGDSGTAAMPAELSGCASAELFAAPQSCSVGLRLAKTVGVGFYAPAVTSLAALFEGSYKVSPAWTPLFASGGRTITAINAGSAMWVQREFSNLTSDALVSVATDIPVTAATRFNIDVNPLSASQAGGLSQPARAIVVVRNSDSTLTRVHYTFSTTAGSTPAETASDRYQFTQRSLGVWSRGNNTFTIRSKAPNAVRVVRVHLGGRGTTFAAYYDNVEVYEPVTSIRFVPDTATIPLSATRTLAWVAQTAAGDTVTSRIVAFASLTQAIATVNAAGTVTGVTAGNAQIVVSVDGVADTAFITVVPAQTLTIAGTRSGGSGVITSAPSGIECTITAGNTTAGTCNAQFAATSTVTLTATPTTGGAVHSWQDGLLTTLFSTGVSGTNSPGGQVTGCAQDANGNAPAVCAVTMSGARTVGVGLYAPADTTFADAFSDNQIFSAPAWTILFPDSATGQVYGNSFRATVFQGPTSAGVQKRTLASVATDVRITASTELQANVALGTSAQNSGTTYPGRIVMVTENAAGTVRRVHYLFGPSAGTLPANTDTDRYVYSAVNHSSGTGDVFFRVRETAPEAVRVRRVHIGTVGENVFAFYDNLQLLTRVGSVLVSPAEPAVQPGDSVQLVATVLGIGGDTLSGRAVTWSSNSEATATVTSTGLVRGVAGGLATVTATVEGVQGSTTINVVTNRTLNILGILGGGSGSVVSTPAGIDCTITNGAVAATGCSATFASDVNISLAATGAGGVPLHAWQDISSRSEAAFGIDVRSNTPSTPIGCARGTDSLPPTTCVIRALTNRSITVSWFGPVATSLNDTFERASFAGGPGWLPLSSDSGNTWYGVSGGVLQIERYNTAASVLRGTELSTRTDIPVSSATEFRMDIRVSSSNVSNGIHQPARAVVETRTSDSTTVRLHVLVGPTAGTLPTNTTADVYHFISQVASSPFTNHRVRVRQFVPQAVAVRRVALGGSGAVFSAFYDNVALAIPVDTVRFVRDTLTLSPSNGFTPTVTFRAADGSEITGRTPTWSSTNTTTATVTSAGEISALSVGSALIVASLEGRADTLSLTVVAGQTLTITSAGMGGTGTITSEPSGISCSLFPGTSGTCSRSFPPNASVRLTFTPSAGHSLASWHNALTTAAASGGRSGSSGSPAVPTGCAATADGIAPATCTITMTGARSIGLSVFHVPVTSLNETFSNATVSSSPPWTPILPDSGTSSTISSFSEGSYVAEVSRTGAGTASRAVRLALATNIPVTAATELRFDVQAVSAILSAGGSTLREYPARVTVHLRNSDSTRTRLHYYYSISGGAAPANTANDRYLLEDVTANAWTRGLRHRLRAQAPSAVRVERIELGGSGWDFVGRYDNISFTEAVQTVRVTPDSLDLLVLRNQQLAATLLGASGDTLSGRAITWVSSDTLVARVNASGLVTSATSGTATITATSEGVAGTARVVVLPIDTLSIVGVGSGGSGVVTSSPSGITCSFNNGVPSSGTCSATFARGDTVTLTATPAGGHALKAWQGGTTFSAVTGGVAGRNAVSDTMEAACRWTDSLAAPSVCDAILLSKRTIGVAWYAPAVTTLNETFADGNFTAAPPWATHYPDSGTTTIAVTAGELSIARTGSNGYAGAAFLSTALNIPVASSTELRLDALATSALVEGGTPSTQYPTRVIVVMSTADGALRRLHLFFSPTNGGLPTNTATDVFEHVPVTLATWSRGLRFRLRDRFSDATSARRIHLGGAGTDFAGGYDNLQFINAVTSVEVTPDSVPLALAGTQQLTVTVRDGAGTTLTGRPILWSSLDPTIATVSASGLVTAVGGGRTRIVVSSEGVSDTVIVDVGALRRLTLTGLTTGGSGSITSSPAGLACDITNGVAAGTGCSALFAEGASVTLTATAGAQFWANTPNFSLTGEALTVTVDSAAQVAGCTVNLNGGASTTCAVTVAANRTVGVGFDAAALTTLSDNFDDGDFRANPAWSPLVGDSGTVTFSINDGALRVQRAAVGTGRGAAFLSVPTSIPVTTNTELRLDLRLVAASAWGDSLYPMQAIIVVQNADLSFTRIVQSYSTTNTGLPTSTATDRYGHTAVVLGEWARSEGLNIRSLAPNATSIRRVMLGGRGPNFEAQFDNVRVLDAVATVTLTPASPTLIAGATQQLSALLRNVNGDTLDGRSITWASSNSAVATVSTTGLVSAVGVGSASITATSEGIGGSTTVTVAVSETLTLVGTGSGGTGTIVSSPAGINCAVTGGVAAGTGCSAVFAQGQVVQLTAAPADGNTLAHWLNTPSVTVSTASVIGNAAFPMTVAGCGPNGAGVWPTVCSVTMSVDRTIGAALLAPAVSSLAETFADGQFTSGPAWTPILPDGGTSTVEVAEAALRVARTGANGAGRGIDVSLQTNVPVSASTELRLDVRAVSSQLSGGGVGTEYPVRAILTVRNVDNSFTRLHYYFSATGGTLPANTATDRYRLIAVAANTWVTGLRFNLRSLWGTAAAVTRVTLGGGGWDFDGRYDNVRFEEAVATVVLTPALDTLGTGSGLQLVAVARDSVGNELAGRSIAWSTLQPGVATVSEDGLVAALAAGEAFIVASVEGIADTTRIVVLDGYFGEDFSGDLSRWVQPEAQGTWSIVGGALEGSYAGGLSCGGSSCSQSQLLPADEYQPTGTKWRVTVRGLFQGAGNRALFVLWQANGVKDLFAFSRFASTVQSSIAWTQERYPGGILTYNNSAPVAAFDPTQPQTYELERDGDTYRFYFNGSLIHSYSHTFATTPKVGLAVYGVSGEPVRYDNFRILVLP